MDQELREYLAAMEQRIIDRTQEMVLAAQTEILRGFERYSTSSIIRLRTIEADFANLRTSEQLRLANLEERIQALESKLLGGRPPNGKPSTN